MKGDDSSKYSKQDYTICKGKFWKNFKASVMYVQDPELKLDYRNVSIPYLNHFPQKYGIMIFMEKNIFDLYIVLMKLVN